MHLLSGDKVLVEYSTFGDRHLGVVADASVPESLLVFAPIPLGAAERSRKDPTITVRYVREGRFKGFTSSLCNTIAPPAGLLEIVRPELDEDLDDRLEPRCLCCFPAKIVFEGRTTDAVVEDMSASCARLRLAGPGSLPQPGDAQEVKLVFSPFDPDEQYGILSRVTKSFMVEGRRYLVLRYVATDVEMIHRISRFVDSRLGCGITSL